MMNAIETRIRFMSKRSPATASLDPARTAAQLAQLTRLRPTLAIVLGSGFGHAMERMQVKARISYAKLTGFPHPSVSGHSGTVNFGWLGEAPVCVLSGRAHFYEGHSMAEVTFPVRVLAAFGIKDVLLTNAAGGINRKFRAGDFMSIEDHINFMGTNPLRGELAPERERFVDLTRTYDPALGALMQRAARSAKVKLHSGVYLGVSGPSYETPAEIVARQCQLSVAGLSCITNLAAGRSNALLSHADVLASGERVKKTAATLIERFAELHAERD